MAKASIRPDSESPLAEIFGLHDVDALAVDRARLLESDIIDEIERIKAWLPDRRVQMFGDWAGEVGELVAYLENRGAG